MNFKKTKFKDVLVIEKTPFEDERGLFSRTYCEKEFSKEGFFNKFVQTNLSISKEKNTLRGMHMQIGEYAEDKLVQCINGKILDVIVDLREDSETFGEHFSIELSDSNNLMLLVPRGFAHGFLTLEDDAKVLYQVSNFYEPSSERGYRWNDPFFNIKWPCEKPIISEKDSSWNDFKVVS